MADCMRRVLLLLLTSLPTAAMSIVESAPNEGNASFVTVGNITWMVGSCSFKALNCDPLADCEENYDNSTQQEIFRCICPPGLDGDGYTNGTGCPNPYTRCVFDMDCHQYGFCNSSLYCKCNEGFIGDGYNVCDDIDECLEQPCDVHADCLNNPGSFSCRCRFKDNFYGDGFQCKHQCISNSDCHPNALCNESTCTCKTGFNGTGLECTDVDECLSSPCLGVAAICVNILGSYRCDCQNGYLRSRNGTVCEKAPQDCEEIRRTSPSASDGMYTIDPDFTGPASDIAVYCDMRRDFAVTEVVVSDDPRDASGSQLLDYNTDKVTLQAIIQNAFFCTQYVRLSCSARFDFGPDFYWVDAFDNNHTSWSGASEEGMCACGQVRLCDVCNCGKGKRSADAGTFVDKEKLPVTFVNWGSTSGSNFIVGNLRCGPRIFDIEEDCSNQQSNGAVYINVDGPFGNPFLVSCDITSFSHVTVIEMQAKVFSFNPTNTSELIVDYVQGLDNVEKVINSSVFCKQYVKYLCKNSPININQTYVIVTSDRRPLTYFPGANGVENACACGATASCDDVSYRCNCDAGGSIWRQDMGDIIEKRDLPVVGMVADTGPEKEGQFYISAVRCAAKQFGIEPNCEKLRKAQGFDPKTYSYFVDPDGPREDDGNVKPFLVQCVFQDIPAQGISVIHHANELAFEVSGNVSLDYLQVSFHQMEALKERSTYCEQEIEIQCSAFSLTWNSSAAFWSDVMGNRFRLDQTLSTCSSGTCSCDGNSTNGKDYVKLTDTSRLPVTFVDFRDLLQQLTAPLSSAQVRIGPFMCYETFPTCYDINAFIQSGKGVEGEAKPQSGYYTIDLDGAGSAEAFEVECRFPETSVTTSTPTGNVVPNGASPSSRCYDIVYTDRNGTVIKPEQLLLLRDISSNCYQELTVSCQYAKAYGYVNYTTCDGVQQIGWAGSSGEDSCACGVGGYCAGSRNNKCNCDVEDGVLRSDGAIIIRKSELPVCQICMSVDGISPNSSQSIPFRRLEFRLSAMVCHPGSARGIQKSCQDVRTQAGVIPAETLQIVYMVPNQPIPVACRLLTDPFVGQLEIRPLDSTYVIPPTQNVTITIRYYATNITVIHDLMQTHVYCSQRLYFFCVSPGNNITLGGDFGWISIQGDLQYNWETLSADEIPSELCSLYPEQCQQCGQPAGFAIHQKSRLPITGLRLPLVGPVTVVVDDVRCTDVFETCYQIMADGDQSPVLPGTREYVIDPDGAGGLQPFQVKCDLRSKENCAWTEVPVRDTLVDGVRGQNIPQPGGMSTPVVYRYASEDQINTLISVSPFCLQAVEFECLNTKLINSGNPAYSYYTLRGKPFLAFGTDNNTDVIGCPCSFTGTCGQGVSCHCDASSGDVSADWGMVTRKDKLPISSVVIGGQTTSTAYGIMTAGSTFCTNCINRYPRDCQEAIEWGERYGINYRRSGEFYINPKPGVVDAFPVYCKMNVSSTVGVTVIHSATPPRTPMGANSSSGFSYFVASSAQILALIEYSVFCYQPVKYECHKAMLLGGGAYWTSYNNVPRRVWGSDVTGSCTCGAQSLCGGLDSRTNQRNRKCNCDAHDEKWRVDAGLLTNKAFLPVTSMRLENLANDESSSVLVTLADLSCSRTPLEFNECSQGFHECNEHAECKDNSDGYTCTCKRGWEGKNKMASADSPRANGRDCWDDDECSFEPCPYNTDCINLPGTYNCTCKPGWQQTGPTTCIDINECTLGIAKCDVNAYCINQQGTFKCVCKRSYRGSGEAGDCHPVGVCKIFGDPHTYSYDNSWVHYQGNTSCVYVATQDGCDGSARTFRVLFKPWQQNPPLLGVGQFTWIEWVKVQIAGHEIMLKQGRLMTVDGIAVHGFTIPGILLVDNGRQAILQTNMGLELYWDGEEELTTVYPRTSHSSMCGLCGNNNLDPSDDWIVGPGCAHLEGQVTTNYQVFGNSWVDPEHLASNPQCAADCDSPPPQDNCYSPLPVVTDYCDSLFNISMSPFSDCIRVFNAKLLAGMRESCIFDLCHIQTDIMKTLCFLAQSLAEDCQLNYLFPLTAWRNDNFCAPQCSGNMTYKVCGPDPNNPTQPETTCLQVREAQLGLTNSVVGCLEGCYCEVGYVKEGNRCIEPSNCGCLFEGSYIPLGETNTAVGCVQTVRCKPGGVLDEVQLQCGPHASCRLENEVVGCHCDPGYLGDGVTCSPDPCYNVTCHGVGIQCVKGVCQCMAGFTGDCEKCDDIDECASKIDSCDREKEKCVNTPGSYTCICKDGYIRVGHTCTDVDECKHEIFDCPENSMCVNKPGKYSCNCCIGYSISQEGFCIVNNEEQTLYRGAGTACCTCSSSTCDTPGRVCGSDGLTYDNLRALIVQPCMNGTRAEPLYAGQCKNTCNGVICSRPFSTCSVAKGTADCICPKCIVDDNIPVWLAVCGSDHRVYRTLCELKAQACSANNIQLVPMSSMAYCTGTGQSTGLYNTTSWSECNVDCGVGEATRTVYSLNQTGVQYNITSVCYKHCEELGPCDLYKCAVPGQICVELNGAPRCQCPSCEEETYRPVCGALQSSVDTYDNDCLLRAAACQQQRNYYILANVSCEAAPITCSVTQNFLRQADVDGCVNPVPFDYGKCGGGCGTLPDKCCYKSRVVTADVPFECPDGQKKVKQMEVVKACTCIPPEEVARRELS